MPSSDDLSFEALWSRSSTGTLSHAEFWIMMLELEKKVWGAPENQASLEDCERRIQVLKDWVRAGNEKGLPPAFHPSAFANMGPVLPRPMNHESTDGLKCKMCGIEKIYWEHFPACSRFKPSRDVVRTAFKSGEMREGFLVFIEKELKRLEGLNIPPDQKKALKEHLESLKTDNPTPFPFPKPKPGRFGNTSKRPKINPRPDIP
jgi:hypothetical protein